MSLFLDIILRSALVGGFCVSRKVGVWGHLQGDMHMVAVVVVCRNALVGTGWSNSCFGCANGLRKHCSHLVGSSFLASKAIWPLSGCLVVENAV